MRDQGVQGGRRRGRFWREGRFNGHRLRIVQHRAADGYTLDSSDEEREKADFFHDETGGRLNISIFPRSPEEEVASLEQVYEGKETTTDQVECNGITWLRFTGPDNGHTLFATAPATGETVRVSIGWKIDWDAAVPMMEALKLK